MFQNFVYSWHEPNTQISNQNLALKSKWSQSSFKHWGTDATCIYRVWYTPNVGPYKKNLEAKSISTRVSFLKICGFESLAMFFFHFVASFFPQMFTKDQKNSKIFQTFCHRSVKFEKWK